MDNEIKNTTSDELSEEDKNKVRILGESLLKHENDKNYDLLFESIFEACKIVPEFFIGIYSRYEMFIQKDNNFDRDNKIMDKIVRHPLFDDKYSLFYNILSTHKLDYFIKNIDNFLEFKLYKIIIEYITDPDIKLYKSNTDLFKTILKKLNKIKANEYSKVEHTVDIDFIDYIYSHYESDFIEDNKAIFDFSNTFSYENKDEFYEKYYDIIYEKIISYMKQGKYDLAIAWFEGFEHPFYEQNFYLSQVLYSESKLKYNEEKYAEAFDIVSYALTLAETGLVANNDQRLTNHEDEIGVSKYIMEVTKKSAKQRHEQQLAIEKQQLLLISEQEKQQARLEEQQKHNKIMETIIRRNSHYAGNNLFPSNLFEIANKLKKHIDYKRESKILLQAYSAELFFKINSEIDQLRLTNNNKLFKEKFLSSMLYEGEQLTTTATNLKTILSDTITSIIAKIFNSRYNGETRDKIIQLTGKSIADLNSDFEDQVFFQEKVTSLDWFSSHIAPINIKTSATWESFFVKEEHYAQSLFFNMFTELLNNAVKYAAMSENYFLDIDLSEDDLNLYITWKNKFEKITPAKSGNGLYCIKEDLERLNSNDANYYSFKTFKENDTFFVVMQFRKSELYLGKMKNYTFNF